MSYWNNEKDKAISIRVNARKYEMVKAYIEQNKYRSYPMLSFGLIFDEALDRLIKEKNITEPKPIKGQRRMNI